jgi:hypothetical protein
LPTPYFAGQQPTEAECFAVSFGLFRAKYTIFTEILHIFSTFRCFFTCFNVVPAAARCLRHTHIGWLGRSFATRDFGMFRAKNWIKSDSSWVALGTQ